MLEGVMLAAGQSQRFAGIKQLATINGRSMLEHCINQYYPDKSLLSGIAHMSVVLGANESLIRQLDLQNVTLFSAPNWQRGMGASLADFVKQIPPSTTHLLIGLGDQIALTSKDIAALLDISQQFPQSIVCAQYGEVLSVPAIFPRCFFEELTKLNSDKGAKLLFTLHRKSVITVLMPNAALDIDTQLELQNALVTLF